ncbi:gluconolactonase [Pseudoroseomonas deserti]|uniref:Gluconolactonase n=1 Tax=Teichococcus deserti TaxID=1817963 RepID=A0A1V2H7X8_9PROT|nr:SMP-30/gluconolactonase/LRE family protein [Pseudoroseomonas deserti]ONG58033.1 gluconolactonase [Pseudoroseomonas deserti]
MSFFAPPPQIETSVFSRLPNRFRQARRTSWSDANRAGRPVDSFLEGPSFDCEGRLYVTDIPFGRIFRISTAGEWEQVAEYDGWPNGLKIHRDGRIFITDYKRGIMLLDPGSGRVIPFLETARSESFKGVNDLVFGPQGEMYFTDQGQTGLQDPSGRVYRLDAAGRLDCLIDTVPSPNGIVVAPDASFLLVAVTRANQIWRLPLHADGSVTKASIFAHLHGGPSGPDGLALDAEGGLLVAHAGFGTVWRLSARAEPLLRIASCAGWSTTNLAFGGADGRQLFVTESETGSILTATLEVPGLPMFSHAELT